MGNYKNAAACLGLMLSASGFANAASVAASYPSGTLNVTGTILEKACTWSTKDFVIQFPPTQSTAFTAVGDMGPKSDLVNFTLTGCPTTGQATITVAGTAGANANTFKIDTGTGKATGVDFYLYSGGSLFRANNPAVISVDSSGNYSSSMAVQLRANAATVTAGSLDTTLTYTIAYN